MADTSSDYPGALDGQPPYLVDDHDHVPADALVRLKNQIAAIQAEIGADATNFTALGGNGTEYASLGEFLGALFRYEADVTEITTSSTYEGTPVAFTAGRFTEPPFVFTVGVNTTTPGQDNFFEAKNVTKDGFELGDAKHTAGWGGSKFVSWIAIQPLWGLEQDLEF